MTKTKRSGDTSKGQKAGGDYAVGYGRPPKATQFKPGRSGNPRGRPKGAKSEDTMIATSSGPLLLSEPVVYPELKMKVAGISFSRPDILEL